MKLSERWLREWVNPAIETAELEMQLSLSGLEVDSCTPAAADFTGVIVAEILAAERHPNADKLQVCTVTDGQQNYQVVCGAPNARTGLKVAFAQVGAVLPGNFSIKKAKLRDVESFGMLCSEKELGISGNHDGIMELLPDAPTGQNLRDYLQLDDTLFDIDLTPNRSDCLSIAGLAREVSVLNQTDLTPPDIQPVAATHDQQIPVQVSAPKACPRYLARIIRQVNIQATTPLWLRERLRRSGIRSIDPVVDVTNYVMLELGQPMHAFDLAQIDQLLHIRWAKPQEELTLLDGTDIRLDEQTLVIADASKPLALAGIMGGEHSSCQATTQDILLEVAYFDPLLLAGKARSYNLHTESSHRFERGVDFNLQHQAMHRATQLLLDIAGGQPGPITEAVSPEHLPQRAQVTLRKARLAQLLDIELPGDKVMDILTRLGFQPQDQGDRWIIQAPSYRFDINIEVDLIEEIARVYGYDRLPVKAPQVPLIIQGQPEARITLQRLRALMVEQGYQEVITYSFIDPQTAQLFDPQGQFLTLSNPISADLSIMRTSLLPGLVKTLDYNQKRQQGSLRLFETGLTFQQQAQGLQQDMMLAGLISGQFYPESWNITQRPVDFFDLKGDIEALLALTGQPDQWQFRKNTHPALHPGQTAQLLHQTDSGKWHTAGWLGALHPQLARQLDMKQPVYLFEISLKYLQQGQVPSFQGISRFPEMRRDLALVVDQNLPVQELLDEMTLQAGQWLQKISVFDVYQGSGIEKGKKSLALGLTWQHPSRTLTDEEINTQVDQIVSAVAQRFSAELRR